MGDGEAQGEGRGEWALGVRGKGGVVGVRGGCGATSPSSWVQVPSPPVSDAELISSGS